MIYKEDPRRPLGWERRQFQKSFESIIDRDYPDWKIDPDFTGSITKEIDNKILCVAHMPNTVNQGLFDVGVYLNDGDDDNASTCLAEAFGLRGLQAAMQWMKAYE